MGKKNKENSKKKYNYFINEDVQSVSIVNLNFYSYPENVCYFYKEKKKNEK